MAAKTTEKTADKTTPKTAEPLASGTPVRLADREAGSADTKSGLFYPYYRGLTGTVTKDYADGTVSLTVDADSLPEEIRKRHQTGTEAMRTKWLEGLSDEARNKLSAAEKKFSLRYSLLVGAEDLTVTGAPAETAPSAPPAHPVGDDAGRKTLDDYADAEAQHLAEIATTRA